jgi:6-phosphogluconolactonase
MNYWRGVAAVLIAGVLGVGMGARMAIAAEKSSDYRVYIGTFTRGNTGSKGIYLFDFDSGTGTLSNQQLAAEVANPGFLAIHPNKKFMYSVGEMKGADGKTIGAVNSYSIDAGSGKLTLLNQQASGGGGPCYVSLDPTGKLAFVANYGSGGVAVLPIEADGKLSAASYVDQHHGTGPVAARQAGPHAHSFLTDPAGRFAFSPDLGTDKVYIYRVSEEGVVRANDPAYASVPPGCGPRHMTFSPNGKFAYVADEVSSAVTVFAYDANKGALAELQTISTLPENYSGPLNTAAELHVHPNGKFLYASNRGHDSIAIYSIGEDGKLTFIGYEREQIKVPRNFNIDPSAKCMIVGNEKGNSLTVFRIDQETGKLTMTQHVEGIGAPVCVRFMERE